MNYQESTDMRTETTRAIAESVSTSICDLGGEYLKQVGWVERESGISTRQKCASASFLLDISYWKTKIIKRKILWFPSPSSQHCHDKEFSMGLLIFWSQCKTYFASTKKPPRLSHSAWAPAQLSTWRRKMNSKMFWRNRCAFCVFCNVLLATSKPR